MCGEKQDIVSGKAFLGNLISGEHRSLSKTRNYYLTINTAANWATADAFTKRFFSINKTKGFAVVVFLKMTEILIYREKFNSSCSYVVNISALSGL